MKAKYILYSLLLLIFAFVPFHQSWTEIYIYQTEPCIRLGSWQIGQSSGSGNTIMTSFITNSEKTCCVKVDVSYCQSQPSSYVYPIEDFDFEITMNNGFTVSNRVESTSGPAASLLSPSTIFSVDAKLEGIKDTTQVETCDELNGRNNIPMKVTVKFKGYYGSGHPKKTVTLEKTWTQDTLDEIRQEYVDMTPSGSRAELPVPSKSSFVPTISGNGNDLWNTGHYEYMIDDGLTGKKSSWLGEVNTYRTANTLSEFTDREFRVNSAYRNPYHQRFHVNAPSGVVASFHSRHCYGDALDVRTIDVDGDSNGNGNIEQVIGNRSQSDDGVLMQLRAIDVGALWTASYQHYSTHTHADWTLRQVDGGDWPPPNDTVYSPPCHLSSVTTETGGTTPDPSTSLMHACDIHDTSVSGSHTSYTCNTSPCESRVWWGCVDAQCPETGSHGKVVCDIAGCQDSTPYDPNSSSGGWHAPCNECSQYRCKGGGHSWQTSCSDTTHTNANGDSCQASGFYACVSHTPVYPAPPPPADIDYACVARTGHRGPPSAATAHRLIPANSWSAYCVTHAFYVCEASAHISMTILCGHTFYKCERGPNHRRQQCSHTNSTGTQCRYRWWKCLYPNVGTTGPSHRHYYNR